MDATKKFKTTEEYIAAFPPKTKMLLLELRAVIRQVAPKAEEVISYNIPAFKLNGMLVYYAGYKNHIGFYPTSSPMKVFKKELANYKTSKGAIQFPIEKGIPKTLVKNIVKYRVKENLEKESLGAKTKSNK